jgi:hypothetical protein
MYRSRAERWGIAAISFDRFKEPCDEEAHSLSCFTGFTLWFSAAIGDHSFGWSTSMIGTKVSNEL